jgi:AraC family transcriptional regulator, regulatory protein of adaptative response / methylphosphotriester-DNA alkyltransferase methyltransferase
MRVTELALSQAASPSLARAGIHDVEQLAEHTTGELLRRPELSSGVELYELICELHRHGLTPFSGHGGHIQTAREREMFRLRAVEGLTQDEIGERFGVNRERVRQLLHLHFRLDGVPPAAKAPRPRARPRSDPSLEAMRPQTFRERRRLYLLARVVIMRYYRTSLTIEAVAKSLASSPRQLQRAFAQFGNSTFREDLRARRMAAAAELLSQPAIQVSDVARLVGYRQPSHFARAFRCLYGVPPTVFRDELHQATCREAPGMIAG